MICWFTGKLSFHSYTVLTLPGTSGCAAPYIIIAAWSALCNMLRLGLESNKILEFSQTFNRFCVPHVLSGRIGCSKSQVPIPRVSTKLRSTVTLQRVHCAQETMICLLRIYWDEETLQISCCWFKFVKLIFDAWVQFALEFFQAKGRFPEKSPNYLPIPLIWTTCTTFFWMVMWQKIWAGVSSSLPIPKLTQYIQLVKSGQKFWQPPPPSFGQNPKEQLLFFGRPSLTIRLPKILNN